MGTCSLTKVMSEDSDTVCAMYRHYDGDPGEHGKELATFLDGFVVSDGLPLKVEGKMANGAGCLAAQMICNFKKEPGNFYMVPTNEDGEGYNYVYLVIVTSKGIIVQVYDKSKVVFHGNVPSFKIFCSETKEQ
jgi:hypothetical protein